MARGILRDVTFAQLYKEGELIPGASKQKVNDKIHHYEVAYATTLQMKWSQFSGLQDRLLFSLSDF